MRRWLSSLKEGKRQRLDNGGSAMITVIVVVMFVTILATTLLYVSGMNYQIKQTDYRNKKSFYTGETTLENIRAQFMKDASDAAVLAYQTTSQEYVALGSGAARRTKYNQEFVAHMKTRLQDTYHANGDWANWMNSQFATTGAVVEVADPFNVLDASHEVEGYLVVQGVKVTYTDPNGYTAEITTDFWIQAPDFNWDQHNDESGNPIVQEPIDLSDYVQYVKWTKQ